jgi:hypothetical protein
MQMKGYTEHENLLLLVLSVGLFASELSNFLVFSPKMPEVIQYLVL